MLKPALVLFAGAVAVSAVAFAQAPGKPGSMTLDQFLQRQTGKMMAADSDGDGRISRAEMAAAAKGGHDPSKKFDRMDTNHDGYLDAAEIKVALTRRFQKMDADGDGVVTAQERAAAKMHKGKHRDAGEASPAQ